MAGKSASAFDVRVGERLRAARMTAGVSQAELGRLLGVSFQQIQRYERGVNRLPAYALGVLEERLGLAPGSLLSEAKADEPGDEKARFWGAPGALELARIYVGNSSGCGSARPTSRPLAEMLAGRTRVFRLVCPAGLLHFRSLGRVGNCAGGVVE